MKQIEFFFQSEKQHCNSSIIEDNTVEDLHLNEVFQLLNQTISAIGSQYLYKMIRCIPKKSELANFEDWINAYSSNSSLQKKTIKHLSRLKKNEAYYIYPLINQSYQPYKKHTLFLLRILQTMPSLLLGLFLIFQSGGWLIALLFTFLVNLTIHYRSKAISFTYSDSIPQLFILIQVAHSFLKIKETAFIKQDLPLKINRLNTLKRNLSFFRLQLRIESDILILAWLVNEFFRIFFLIEPIGLNTVFALIDKNRGILKELYSFVGLIDCLQTMAEIRKQLPYYTLPEFPETGNMEITDMYHPLISNCVSNSFSIKEKSFLVLGSNMSGKTSFIRTIGVNTVIAQTLNICFAKQFSCRRKTIHTLLSVNDNLLQGESYYLSEILRMKKIIHETEQGDHLILLDELFKGTNTSERIAVAKAVLEYLAENTGNRIVAASHDRELVSLLSARYTALYFTENIRENKLSFDYKVSTTPNTQRNAIRILGVYDYPNSIIENALKTEEGLL